MLIVDDRIAVRGPMRDFIEATTHHKVCDAVDNDLSAIDDTTELPCDRAEEAWAADIRMTRHIGDFCGWKEHDKYRVAFERLMRNLRAATSID